MKKLISLAKERDVDLYFDGISCFAYDSGLLEGLFPSGTHQGLQRGKLPNCMPTIL